MSMRLTPYQQRVIGSLLEKEVTTPDHYPLTLNALTTAVNQKSNREPVYTLTDADVLDVVNELIDSRLISPQEGMGSRVCKYQHRFCNTPFGNLTFTEQEKAIICVLLLRGPQTAGELRTRTQRLCEFADMQQVENTLSAMIEAEWIVKLAREPGKRESRYIHLFGESAEASAASEMRPETETPELSADNAAVPNPSHGMNHMLEARVDALEQEVASLREALNALLSK